MMERFNDQEKLILNSVSEGFALGSLTRDRILDSLAFSSEISTDEDILNLLEAVSAKVEDMSDEEWNMLKQHIPLKTQYEIYSP